MWSSAVECNIVQAIQHTGQHNTCTVHTSQGSELRMPMARIWLRPSDASREGSHDCRMKKFQLQAMQ